MQRDFELSVRRVYEAVLRAGDIAVDVGAHIGTHAIPMAQAVAPGGKVYAVEPLPGCRKQLLGTVKQIGLKKVVEVLDCALGETDDKAEFIEAVDAPYLSGLQKRKYDVETRTRTFRVKVKRFDKLFLGLPKLKYIKVDAEGGEYHCFRGGYSV